MLRKVTIKIRLERIDTQEEVIVEVLLDSGATGVKNERSGLNIFLFFFHIFIFFSIYFPLFYF